MVLCDLALLSLLARVVQSLTSQYRGSHRSTSFGNVQRPLPCCCLLCHLDSQHLGRRLAGSNAHAGSVSGIDGDPVHDILHDQAAQLLSEIGMFLSFVACRHLASCCSALLRHFGPVVYTLIASTRQVLSVLVSCMLFQHDMSGGPCLQGISAVLQGLVC